MQQGKKLDSKVVTKIVDMYFNEKKGMHVIAKELGLSLSTVHGYISKHKQELQDTLGEQKKKNTKVSVEKRKNEEQKLSSQDKKKLDLVSQFTPQELRLLLEQIQKEERKIIKENIGKPGEIKLAILSDTHLNNKLCDLESLHKFYEDAEKAGVDAFIHAGDLTDGYGVYQGQIFELINLSFEEQLRYVEENYPKIKGKKTYFISGNHDESWLKSAGINFGNAISKLRDDMVHLGFYNAKIYLNGFVIELQHGGGSNPYALSYHLQKYMERIPQSEQVDLYVLGHYHRELFMMYRGSLAMLPGAFLRENLLAKRYKLGNNICGRILQIKRKEDGSLEYIPHLYKYH